MRTYTRAELLDAPQKRRALHWRNSPFINTDFREIQLRGSSAHNERPVNTQLFFDGRALSRSEWSELDINLIAASRIQTPEREGLWLMSFWLRSQRQGTSLCVEADSSHNALLPFFGALSMRKFCSVERDVRREKTPKFNREGRIQDGKPRLKLDIQT